MATTKANLRYMQASLMKHSMHTASAGHRSFTQHVNTFKIDNLAPLGKHVTYTHYNTAHTTLMQATLPLLTLTLRLLLEHLHGQIGSECRY